MTPPLLHRHHYYRPSRSATFLWAGMYVASGICQPLIMTLCKQAGLANASAQLYMFFYYLGLTLVLLTLIEFRSGDVGHNDTTTQRGLEETDRLVLSPQQQQQLSSSKNKERWPSPRAMFVSAAIAEFDIVAAGMNYTGASLAGPTLFAIMYSSVTVWAAIFSQIFLGRRMSTAWQWVAVLGVFLGLTVTAVDSLNFGPNVVFGTVLVLVGSMMHGGTYVMNEAIMTRGEDRLSIRQNSGFQGAVAALTLGLWQLFFTVPRWDELLGKPARASGTTWVVGLCIMLAFMLANLVHSLTYFHTLKYYPGGATSAGIMKALQAALVFVAAHFLYCLRGIGGREMCFSFPKLISVIIVSTGVGLFGYLTELQERQRERGDSVCIPPSPSSSKIDGYGSLEGQFSADSDVRQDAKGAATLSLH